mgnify:CR=1 FL=1
MIWLAESKMLCWTIKKVFPWYFTVDEVSIHVISDLTHYAKNLIIFYLVKMEYLSKINIFGLKTMVKSG